MDPKLAFCVYETLAIGEREWRAIFSTQYEAMEYALEHFSDGNYCILSHSIVINETDS